MKAYELYRLWADFESMMASSLPDEKKIQMGEEWVRNLPPRLVCASSQLSYDIVKEAMQGRLSDLKNGTRTDTPKETSNLQGQVQAQGNERRQKPVRKAKQDS